jgi:hypothetical protein
MHPARRTDLTTAQGNGKLHRLNQRIQAHRRTPPNARELRRFWIGSRPRGHRAVPAQELERYANRLEITLQRAVERGPLQRTRLVRLLVNSGYSGYSQGTHGVLTGTHSARAAPAHAAGAPTRVFPSVPRARSIVRKVLLRYQRVRCCERAMTTTPRTRLPRPANPRRASTLRSRALLRGGTAARTDGQCAPVLPLAGSSSGY